MNIRCPHCARIVTVPDGATAGEGQCANCGRAVNVAEAERVGLSRGQVLGGCRVDGIVGLGGMAVVHRATQLSMERPVALKVLAPRLAQREQFVERFDREATMLAQLSHPNIVHIFDKGHEGDDYYLVMELIEGESLRSRLRREGRLAFDQAAAVFDNVAAGLEYAHERGVFHQDIKPENILIDESGLAKIGDFGIARMLGEEEAEAGNGSDRRMRLGSGPYMAPEQRRHDASPDHRVDIYALGVLLHEMLTGGVPTGDYAPASKAAEGVPIGLDRVIARALADDPAERFPTVASFRAAVARAARPKHAPKVAARTVRRRARRHASPVPFVIVLAILALALLAWLLAARARSRGEAPGPELPVPGPLVLSTTPDAASADPRERTAEELLDGAAALAGRAQWREARVSLERLRREFADTTYFAASAAAIEQLDERVEAALKPKPATASPAPRPASATPAPPARPKPRVVAELHGLMHANSDGQLELYYDWSSPAQFDDWDLPEGMTPSVVEGELRFGGRRGMSLNHIVPFAGEAEVAGTWRILETHAENGHCAIGVCSAPWRCYWLFLRDWRQTIYRMDKQPRILGTSQARCQEGQAHTFHFARWGPTMRAWIDGKLLVRARDGQYGNGAVKLGSWRASVGIGGVWLRARPDPAWLKASPALAARIETLRLYSLGIGRLAPFWEKHDFAGAGAEAAKVGAAEPFTGVPEAAKWLAEDADALVGFGKAVEAGIAKLQPGDRIRIAGVGGAFQKTEDGSIFIQQGAVSFGKKIAELSDEELVGLATRARPLDTGRDHIALALLWSQSARPDLERARTELALARKAGADVTRHMGLLMPRPATAQDRTRRPKGRGKWLVYKGQTLLAEAEEATRRIEPMAVGRDPGASGNAFVWEPWEAGQDQYGNRSGRVVFQVYSKQPASVYLWARVLAKTNSSNSFRLGTAKGTTSKAQLHEWHFAPAPVWNWQPYTRGGQADRRGGEPSELQLEVGMNSIIVAIRERGCGLDRISLSPSPEPPE